MQMRNNDTQLLYGLFQSICGWALDNGYRDIATMKQLLKLAMVDVASRQYCGKPATAKAMSIVADLGISLRNVQSSLKALSELDQASPDFVKIRQIQEEILIFLSGQPRTADQILSEVCYMLHAPYDLQRRTLRTILEDLEKRTLITSETENGYTYYRPLKPHVNIFDPSDMSAQLSGLLTHIDAYNHTIGRPYFAIFNLPPFQAGGLQTAMNEFIRGTGNSYEYQDSSARNGRAFTYYVGCAPLTGEERPTNVSEAMLEVIQTRFKGSDLPSFARTHWYHLTRISARKVFQEVRNFIEREAGSTGNTLPPKNTIPFAIYFGLADRQTGNKKEEMQS
jgi:hypothetical protein